MNLWEINERTQNVLIILLKNINCPMLSAHEIISKARIVMVAKNIFFRSILFLVVICLISFTTLSSPVQSQTTYQVTLIQGLLILNGHNPGQIDGIIGFKTKQAILQFQQKEGLVLTGIADVNTCNKLISNLASQLNLSLYQGLLNPSSQENVSEIQKTLTEAKTDSVLDYKRRLVPKVAENGSVYGELSPNTGRPKEVYVRGYYRKDGTYVRGHYRSRPRR